MAGAKRQQKHYTAFLHNEQPSTRRFAHRRYELKRMPIEKREALAARLLGTGVGGQMKVGRQLENGDTMLVNRQVSTRTPTPTHPPTLKIL